MPPQYPLSSERQTEYLRASVVDAALTLGPNVANLIFADSILEEPSESGDAKILYIPDLYSLSPSAAAGPFSAFSHDTDFSSSSSGIGAGSSESRYGGSPKPKSRGAPSKDNYLESPFVVISKTDEAQDAISGTTSKKGIKNFTFLSRKHQQQPASKEHSPERGRPTISKPRRLHPALDDPVLPIMISMPTYTRSEGSTNSTQSTPTKSRKRGIQHTDDLSISTGKSTNSKVLTKPNRKKVQDEDSGYVSEGTGLSSLKSKARRKAKSSISPPPRGSQQKSTDAPVSLPIADRFVRKKSSVPQPLKIPQIKFPPPSDNANANGNGNISLPNSSFLVVSGQTPPFPKPKNSPISDKSFVMVPDLNIMKRLGLDKYVSEINASGGAAIGANNEIKLQVMEMLLKNSNKNPEEEIPAINVVPPRPTRTLPSEPTEYHFLPPPTPIIRGKDSPFPKSPIRGRESPFPIRPLYRPTVMHTTHTQMPARSQSAAPGPLRFKLPSSPDRYNKNVNFDLPRSVRSSYEKDLEREEEEAPSSSISDRVKARRAVAASNDEYSLDSPSVYSMGEGNSIPGRI